MSFGAVLDANVLVPARVRDVLLTLAEVGLYRPLWSDVIVEEVTRHLPASMDAAARARLLAAMTSAFPEALVQWPDGLTFDALGRVNGKDHHVVLAAVHSGADAVVTNDAPLREEGLAVQRNLPGDLDFQSCAEFTAYAVDVDRGVAAAALQRMIVKRWRLTESAQDWERFLGWMGTQGWSNTADLLRRA